MKVALIHFAAPPVVGGVETVLARQAEQFCQNGHAVLVLAGRGDIWKEEIAVQILPELDSRYALVLRYKADLDRGVIPAGFDDFVGQLYDDLSVRLAGVDWVIAHNVGSLHKNLALTAALFKLSQRATSPKFILWHHDFAWENSNYQGEMHPGWPWDLLRREWPGVKAVVISEARLAEYTRLTGAPAENVAVIPAGVDLPVFLGLQETTQRLAARFGLTTAAPLLLAPVRVTRRKNLEFGLEILAAVRKELPQARWLVTGPLGAHNPANLQYMTELLALRDQLHLKEAAIFLAETIPQGLKDSEVADFYRLADALLLPSQEEGFGIPIIEAGLGRVIIFCSDLKPLRALGQDYATYFRLDQKAEEVARLIVERLEADPVYQLRSRVRREFTWEGIYARKIAPLLNGRAGGGI